MTYGGSALTGSFCDVIWDGTGWIAVTLHGEIFTASTASGTWTRIGAPLPSGIVTWRLRTDGAGTLLAFPVSTTAVAWYYSLDHGATWTLVTQPDTPVIAFEQTTDVQFVNGLWLATLAGGPYLQSSNDVTDPTRWVPVQLPYFVDSATGAFLLAYAAGRIVCAWRDSFMLLSGRAQDLAPGPWEPMNKNPPLTVAAYLWNTLVSSTAPTDGQTLVYVAADKQWEPKSAAPPLFNPNSATVTFPLTGTHDYTADSAYSPATYPDNQSTVTTGRLGDGVIAPTFFAINKVNINALALTSGNTLRMTTAASSMTGDTWPTTDTVGGAPLIFVPLPNIESGVIQFTMAANIVSAWDGGDQITVSVGLLRAVEAGVPRAIAQIQWTANSGGFTPCEHLYLHGTAYSLANLATFTSGGICTRIYKINLDGPGAAISGQPPGGGAFSLLHGRNDPELIASRRDYMLCMRIFAPSGISVNAYVEIGGLSITAERQ